MPFFNEHAGIADQHGLNYRGSLEFIICMRNGGSDYISSPFAAWFQT